MAETTLIAALNVAGVAVIAFLLVKELRPAIDAGLRETRVETRATSRAVSRMARSWALTIIHRKDVPREAHDEAQAIIDETRADEADMAKREEADAARQGEKNGR